MHRPSVTLKEVMTMAPVYQVASVLSGMVWGPLQKEIRNMSYLSWVSLKHCG